ncbi:MAG: YmdB family metallophosphoesterase, partial [Clostridia bacterium]|nr:YmdB family metallophosphoesterase [Clostridia bacterium]
MNILAVGDLIGNAGVRKLKSVLPKLREQENIDFIIVNGENSAEGMGITEKNFNDILAENVDVITMGNHTWGKKDIFNFIDHPKLIRPANYPKGVVGKGYNIYQFKNKKIAVINLLGRVDINVLTENPFIIAKDIISKIKNT